MGGQERKGILFAISLEQNFYMLHLLYKRARMEQRFEHRLQRQRGGPLNNFIWMKSFSQRSLNLVEKLVHSVKLYI